MTITTSRADRPAWRADQPVRAQHRSAHRRRARLIAMGAVLLAAVLLSAPSGWGVARAAATGGLRVTSALQVVPATSATSMLATFTVRNDGSTSISVDYFLVGARSSSGAKADFPVTSPVTLSPGQSYTYSRTRTLAAGSYTAWPAFYDGTNWIELAPHSSFTVAAPCTPAYGNFGPGSWPPACWRPYSATTSPFNQTVPASPTVRSDSATKIKYLLGTIATNPYPDKINVFTNGTGGEPTYWSKPTDPQYTLNCVTWACGDLQGASIRIPAKAVPEAGSDHHLAVIDQSSGWEYDLWRVGSATLNPNGGKLDVGSAGKARIDGDGTTSKDSLTATASYFGSDAGRVRAEEVRAGVINHALFIDVNCDSGKAVYPARHGGQSCTKVGQDPAQALPMGSWLQLSMTDAEINAPSIPAWERPYLRAMATYGMYIGDTGSDGYFSIEAESGSQYTVFGYPDPWLSWAQTNQGQTGWSFYQPGNAWVGTWAGVDWKNRLRVLCNPNDSSCPR